ncbi:MAG: helix-turn-helix transcriptional regulator [Candidatus Limnocylindrales bacterium]
MMSSATRIGSSGPQRTSQRRRAVIGSRAVSAGHSARGSAWSRRRSYPRQRAGAVRFRFAARSLVRAIRGGACDGRWLVRVVCAPNARCGGREGARIDADGPMVHSAPATDRRTWWIGSFAGMRSSSARRSVHRGHVDGTQIVYKRGVRTLPDDGRMASREGRADGAARRARERVEAVISEIRRARISAGLSQDSVAAAASISRFRLGRIERLRERGVPADVLMRMADAVGLDLPLRLFPGTDAMRDAGQLRLLLRLTVRLDPGWTWQEEVPLPIIGDRRAWDAVGVHTATGLVIHVEAETRLADVQALLRRVALKRRDGRARRLVLVVADTRNNREVIRVATRVIVGAFPADARRALAMLDRGADPGADVMLML